MNEVKKWLNPLALKVLILMDVDRYRQLIALLRIVFFEMIYDELYSSLSMWRKVND
ncbi:MAG: hypothetical protein MK132_16230 [Lentisphaerales bacterium]|nr:hypothetical protein [Lentisphaerales bacterium]